MTLEQEVQALAEDMCRMFGMFKAELDACRADLTAITEGLDRTIVAGDGINAKLATLEGDVSRIRRHLDRLPDDAIPGHGRRR